MTSSDNVVIKRNGETQAFDLKKIYARILNLCKPRPPYATEKLTRVDPEYLIDAIQVSIANRMTTTELDTLLAETCAARAPRTHPHYDALAARVSISNYHKNVPRDILQVARRLYNFVDAKTKRRQPQLAAWYLEYVEKHYTRLQQAIDYRHDYLYTYFGFATLKRTYLMRDMDLKPIETPQEMLMRVSIQIHGQHGTLNDVLENYQHMSEHLFIHASPTLYNSGTPRPQLSSCFLLTVDSDSIDGIFDSLKKCAVISKSAGGIGISWHNVRSRGSRVLSTNGRSSGTVPFLQIYNWTARAVNQGGRRPGAFAIYMEPWHDDIFEFLELRDPGKKEQQRALDLFYALWVNDLFMKRCRDDKMWTLFNPNDVQDLYDLWGKSFEQRYTYYESIGMGMRKVRARELMERIIVSQVETGLPYMLYKDACNAKSNQKNLGTIRNSNLCCEIVEYCSKDEIAVCNLASIALPRFIKYPADGKPFFNHQKLYKMVRWVVRNLDRVIDGNYYPLPEARNSNMRHRPMGIGVQGLANVFSRLRLPFTSPEAKELNTAIFETMYYAALSESTALAREKGSYSSFEGSPASKGILQFDMWGVTPSSGRWDWQALKETIKTQGLRNSLLIAPMPTASTAQILGNMESFEPYTDNLYVRRVVAGDFVVYNRDMVDDLVRLELWNNRVRDALIRDRGSIQRIEGIPDDIKALYKTVWEIDQRDLVDMAADRGAYICQSQSFNVHMDRNDTSRDPIELRMATYHMYAWQKGLKTGMYYLRGQPKYNAVQFTRTPDGDYVPLLADSPNASKQETTADSEPTLENLPKLCSLDDPGCLSCQ